MFNGIILQTGKIEKITSRGKNKLITIHTGSTAGLKIGDSVAVDGVCLTIVKTGKKSFQVEAMPETLNLTTLGGTQRIVNLEQPLSLNDKINGHLVTGHIDFSCSIDQISGPANAKVLTIKVPPKYSRYFSLKGSIALNGISLTVSSKQKNNISVSLIPFTWKHTNLHMLKKGSRVNIEIDILARYLSSLIEKIRQ